MWPRTAVAIQRDVEVSSGADKHLSCVGPCVCSGCVGWYAGFICVRLQPPNSVYTCCFGEGSATRPGMESNSPNPLTNVALVLGPIFFVRLLSRLLIMFRVFWVLCVFCILSNCCINYINKLFITYMYRSHRRRAIEAFKERAPPSRQYCDCG